VHVRCHADAVYGTGASLPPVHNVAGGKATATHGSSNGAHCAKGSDGASTGHGAAPPGGDDGDDKPPNRRMPPGGHQSGERHHLPMDAVAEGLYHERDTGMIYDTHCVVHAVGCVLLTR
jgi:hypothetical protein